MVIVAPPFTSLYTVSQLLKDDKAIHTAAQNCYTKSSGAYTGEVSVPMLAEAGCTHVIIGHSERRNYFNETDDMLAEKTDIVLSHGLTPIFCCGENLPERQTGQQNTIVSNQIKNALFHLNDTDIQKIILAYEPVWAIGTGVTATSEQAQEMHAFIRLMLAENYGGTIAQNISILYGGSCNAANAQELFANPDVDGGLIGGASLKAPDFIKIIQAL